MKRKERSFAFSAALDRDKEAKAAFGRLPQSTQMELLRQAQGCTDDAQLQQLLQSLSRQE